MSSKTKIVVLRMKELIYTAVFLGLAVVLITLFLIMFRPRISSPVPVRRLHTRSLHLLHDFRRTELKCGSHCGR